MRLVERIIYVAITTLTLISFQNCAKYDFKPTDAAQLGQGTDPSLPPTEPEVPNNPPPVVTAPKLSFQVIDCKAGEWCRVIIRLSSPLTKSLSASWRTADEAAATRPNYYAIAGTHYVSASGTFTIPRGVTETQVEIKSIAWESGQVQTLHIPFSFSNCKVDGASTLCADFL